MTDREIALIGLVLTLLGVVIAAVALVPAFRGLKHQIEQSKREQQARKMLDDPLVQRAREAATYRRDVALNLASGVAGTVGAAEVLSHHDGKGGDLPDKMPTVDIPDHSTETLGGIAKLFKAIWHLIGT